MRFSFFSYTPRSWRKAGIILLAFFWTLGLFLGIYSSFPMEDSFFRLMRAAAGCRVSIVGLFAVLILPFLFSAFAVYFSQPWLLLLICFLKAYCFGFCCFLTQISFGSAGWLLRLLLLFSDCCILPVLCWFWIRHISGEKRALWQDLAVCAAASLLIGGVDYCVISPFLATLID